MNPPAKPPGVEHDHLARPLEGIPRLLRGVHCRDDGELDLRGKARAADGPDQPPSSFPRSIVFSIASSSALEVRSTSCSSSVISRSRRGRPGPRARGVGGPRASPVRGSPRSCHGVIPQRRQTSVSVVFFLDASGKTFYLLGSFAPCRGRDTPRSKIRRLEWREQPVTEPRVGKYVFSD